MAFGSPSQRVNGGDDVGAVRVVGPRAPARETGATLTRRHLIGEGRVEAGHGVGGSLERDRHGRRRDLVPFAHSARMDVYAWDRGGAPAPAPVVWSPRESREATRFAPDFSGFLFRVLLLECAGSWHFEDLEPDEFDDLQRRQVATLAPWLGRARHSVLEALVAPGFRADPEDPSVGLVISLEEATALASEHLGGFLDEPVPSRAEPR